MRRTARVVDPRRPGRPACRGPRLGGAGLIEAALVAVLAAVATGCGGPTETPALNREEYVEVYVEMLRASEAAADSTAAARRRAEILSRHGLTPEDLFDFVQRHADEPKVLAEAWMEIEERLRSDTTADAPQTEPGQR